MAALNSVQNRQRELHSLQESVVELAQLYKQLEQMISDQDVAFQEIEASVFRAENDIEKGHGEVTVALVHGYSARRVSTCTGTLLEMTLVDMNVEPFELIRQHLSSCPPPLCSTSGYALLLFSWLWPLLWS